MKKAMKNHAKNQGLATIAVAIAVALLLAAGGAVFVAKNKPGAPSPESTTSVDSTSVDIATGPGAKEFGGSGEGVKMESPAATTVTTVAAKLTVDSKGAKPEDFFRKIRAEFDATKNFTELEAFNLKYASQKYSAEIVKARTAYGTISQSVLENLFTVAKNNLPSSAQIGTITSAATDKNVTLKIATSKNGLQGTVVLVLENGEWKVDSEAWAKTN